MEKINDFNISSCLSELSETEKDFLKETIKNGEECGGFGRMICDPDGKPNNGWFYGYVPTSENLKMLQAIWNKMNKIRATHIINYAPTFYGGDVLLINEKYANAFEQWAKKSGASEHESVYYAD